jgi:hypothetical protein
MLCFLTELIRRKTMPSKRYRPEDILSKLREADILISQGKTVAETIRILGNGWTNIDFDSDDNPCDVESSFCECDGWCAAAEYGSGRLSGGGGGGGTEPSINCSDYNGDPAGCVLAGCRYNSKKETCG